VLLGGDDDQRAAVELTGGLGAVDELSRAPDNSFDAEPWVMPNRRAAAHVCLISGVGAMSGSA
jgi:hypothetical protein